MKSVITSSVFSNNKKTPCADTAAVQQRVSTWLRIHARRCFRKGSAVAVPFAFRFAIDTFNLQVRVICHESSVNG